MRTLLTLICLMAFAATPACAVLDAVNPWSGNDAPAQEEAAPPAPQAEAPPAATESAADQPDMDSPSRSWFSFLTPWSDDTPEPETAPAKPSAAHAHAEPAPSRSWFSFLNPWADDAPEPKAAATAATSAPAIPAQEPPATPAPVSAPLAATEPLAASDTAQEPAASPASTTPPLAAADATPETIASAVAPDSATPAAAAHKTPASPAPAAAERPWYAMLNPWSDNSGPATADPNAAPQGQAAVLARNSTTVHSAAPSALPSQSAGPALASSPDRSASTARVPSEAGRYAYRYYPDDRVYFDLQRKTYWYYDKGDWQEAAMLPHQIATFLGRYVPMRSDAFPPWKANRAHMSTYPPVLKTTEGILIKQ